MPATAGGRTVDIWNLYSSDVSDMRSSAAESRGIKIVGYLLDMPATRVELEMCGSLVIRRKIQSTPVSDMGVINVTYKCKIIIYTDF